jgi:hypothetical protein
VHSINEEVRKIVDKKGTVYLIKEEVLPRAVAGEHLGRWPAQLR